MDQFNTPELATSSPKVPWLIKIGVTFAVLGVIVIGALLAWQWQSGSKGSSESTFVKTFGPGGAPHVPIINPSALKIADIARAPDDIPPPLNRNVPSLVEVNFEAQEVVAEIAPGVKYFFTTYNGQVPGPLIRALEGDTVKINLKNPSTNFGTISIDLHGAEGPGGGGKVQVLPGEMKSFTFKALFPGLFMYHTASGNIPQSVASGGYGMILIEPKQGLPKVDREFYVMQGDYFTKGPIGQQGIAEFDPDKMLAENPSYVVFNGRVGALKDHPLKAKVGEKVRIYFGNSDVSNVSSWHIIGQIFDKVYLEASLLSPPLLGIQTTTVPAGGATVNEITLNYPGDYVPVDHSLSRIEKGAWGVLRVTGEPNPEIFNILP